MKESYESKVTYLFDLFISWFMILYFKLISLIFGKNNRMKSNSNSKDNKYYSNLEISKYKIDEPLLISDFGLND